MHQIESHVSPSNFLKKKKLISLNTCRAAEPNPICRPLLSVDSTPPQFTSRRPSSWLQCTSVDSVFSYCFLWVRLQVCESMSKNRSVPFLTPNQSRILASSKKFPIISVVDENICFYIFFRHKKIYDTRNIK